MPLSIDVTLPRDQEPVFPDRCVVCGVDAPRDEVVLRDRVTGLARSLAGFLAPILVLFPGPKVEVRAPACPSCGELLLQFRRRRGLIEWSVVVAAVAVALTVLVTAEERPGKLVFLGIVLLLIAPTLIAHVFRPAAFGIAAWKTTTDYEFRDRAYAVEFAELNDGEAV